MTRHEQRKQVFKLLFRVEFNAPENMPEQVELFLQDEEAGIGEQDGKRIAERFWKVQERIPEIDRMIGDNTEGWEPRRIGKVEVAVLRLAVYEMCYDDDIPAGVAINEAVEIAKEYGQEASGGFVNAILGKINRAG